MTEVIETGLAVAAPAVPMADMVRMAEAFYKCQLFGYKTPEQALALMLIAQAEGLHPAQAAREYHIIQGRPALTAEAMLSRFQRAGGKVNWITYTATEVTGEFSHPSGGTLAITWTMDRAKRADLTGKDNWRKYPEAMLASRCISEGVRRVCPGSVLGVYTPEETEDFTPQVDDAEYMTTEERREQRQQQAAKPAAPRQSEPASEAVKGVAAQKLAAAKEQATTAGQPRKAVKLTMLGAGGTYPDAAKPYAVFKVLEGSQQYMVTHYNPIAFGERVAAAGDPGNKLHPHAHEGPIICDLTPMTGGGWVASELTVLGAPDELAPPVSVDEIKQEMAK